MAPQSVYDFDFFVDPGLIEQGHDRLLEIVRDAPPIFWTPRNGGHWIVAGHEAAFKAFNDVDRFTVDIASITAELIEAVKPNCSVVDR